ncbi:MAG: PIN domain-containing protein [Acidimicrobiia bacterium]|nr:PIN domain-containing protein [Acidimicrobiia bacterium]
MIADTSGLLALFNRREPAHPRVVEALEDVEGPLVVSPFVLAELDYLVATRLGVEAELAVLHELTSAASALAVIDDEDLGRCAAVISQCRDQEIGVADASMVVLAHRFGPRSVLTLDRRHCDVLRPLDGGRFTLLGA